jgi:dienelactone hydrolase
LAKQGVATLRFNKRYYQYPRTAPTNITIQDEVLKDVALAIVFAKEDEHTKNSKIYVLGHSLGGMLAPYIAQTNSDVSGIVILAGTPRKLEDVILDQNIAAITVTKNKTDAEKQAMIATVQVEVDKVKNLKDSDPSITLFGVPSSYWLSLNKIDTPAITKNLTIPILILQGSADFQVSPEVDYKAWQDLLKDKSNVTFKLYDKLNHLFIVTNGKKDITEYSKKGTVDKQVITDIAAWIKQQ